MHILIASDSFKDALSSREVCLAIERGIRTALPDAQTTVCPLADGGEGTMRVLADAFGLEAVEVVAADPLMRPRKSTYYLKPNEPAGAALPGPPTPGGRPSLRSGGLRERALRAAEADVVRGGSGFEARVPEPVVAVPRLAGGAG